MRALYAQYRLLWQVWAVSALLPLFWAVTWPILIVTGADPTITGTTLEALWLAALAVPPSIAMALALTRADAQRSFTLVNLPRWREDIRAANMATALGIAAVIGMLAASQGGLGAGVVGFSLAVASFATVTVMFDPVLAHWTRMALVVGFTVSVWHFRTVGAALLSVWPLALLLLSGSVALQAWMFSRPRARRWPFGGWAALAMDPRGVRAFWARQRAVHGEWNSPVGATTWSVTRAALHAAARGRGLRYNVLVQAAYAVIAYRLLGLDFFLMLHAGIYFATAPVAVPATPFLPVDRAMRARVAWLGAVLTTLLYVGLVVALLPLGSVIPLGVWLDGGKPGSAPLALALSAMLSPIVHWTVIRWGAMTARNITYRPLGGVGVYLLLGVLTLPLLALLVSPSVAVGALLAGTVASFGLLWLALQRHFSSGDLDG